MQLDKRKAESNATWNVGVNVSFLAISDSMLRKHKRKKKEEKKKEREYAGKLL